MMCQAFCRPRQWRRQELRSHVLVCFLECMMSTTNLSLGLAAPPAVPTETAFFLTTARQQRLAFQRASCRQRHGRARAHTPQTKKGPLKPLNGSKRPNSNPKCFCSSSRLVSMQPPPYTACVTYAANNGPWPAALGPPCHLTLCYIQRKMLGHDTHLCLMMA